MDTQVLVFPQNNDVTVLSHFGPEITDATGLTSTFYYKDNRYTADTDDTTLTFHAAVIPDPDYPGQFMAQFVIPKADNQIPNTYWWRVDVSDVANTNRTAKCGTLLVEAVLWQRKLREKPGVQSG
jgi:hypothetical protein